MIKSKNPKSPQNKELVLTNENLYILSQGNIFKIISLNLIKKIKWCYSSKAFSLILNNGKDLDFLMTIRLF